jgi:hypothetical protein
MRKPGVNSGAGPAPGERVRIALVSDGGVAVGILGRRRKVIGVAFSVVLVLVAIALAARGDGGDDAAQARDTSPRLVDSNDLLVLADSLGHPIYWAGSRSANLELTQEADGSVYLRYLPPGTDAGDSRPQFLTVGTYPVADAVAALQRTADKAGTTLGRAPGGGVVLVNPSSQGSVYLAYPGSDLQIEVYDPAPGRALGLIRSDAIQPVG